MNPDLEFILDMDLLDEVDGGAGTLLPDGEHTFKIRGAGFYNRGVRISQYEAEHFALFLATSDETALRRVGNQRFQQISRPEPDHSFPLSNVLVAHISMLIGADEEINWHQAVTKPFPSSGARLRKSLQTAIDLGFVRYAMDIIPNNWPDFLPHREKKQ
jgi:hypothetical protein